MLSDVLAIILGGGRGERLYPLTRERAKPAVPFGGKYRLVDIPISNCIHSGFNRIYLLTQFNSSSLHNHIAHTYIFDSFSNGFVEILAAEQTFEHTGWYKGTADAVRQNFLHFRTQNPGHYLILSGDQLYRMDLADFFQRHLENEAEISVAVTPVAADRVSQLGILQLNDQGRITAFIEKPPLDQDIDSFKIPPALSAAGAPPRADKPYLASMGIYLFKTGILKAALDNQLTDFGKEILPAAIDRFKVFGYVFNGFWEDIGTLKSFYETNIGLTAVQPDFDFYDKNRPIYTRRRDLPASKINSSTITQTLTADGCIITNANIMHSIIGIRTIIESGASLDGVISMGADFYETPEQKAENAKQGLPDIGIGRGALIRRAIIDKNARIGEVCRIGIDNIARKDGDYDHYHVREGIIVIPKNGVVPTGTVI
jgi:glucose-1-phosphate adenylyltransferase